MKADIKIHKPQLTKELPAAERAARRRRLAREIPVAPHGSGDHHPATPAAPLDRPAADQPGQLPAAE